MQHRTLDSSMSYYQYSKGPVRRKFLGSASARVRRELFALFLNKLEPQGTERILDIGVTTEMQYGESNTFERLYAFPDSIVGISLDPLVQLKSAFQRIILTQADGLHLPFGDQSFDIIVSNATIEHVGSRTRQRRFVQEVVRVGRRCFISTPNRWFPLELHTFLPLIHYLPSTTFRGIVRGLNMDFYARKENLNLLSRRELNDLFPSHCGVRVFTSSLHSNLIAIV